MSYESQKSALETIAAAPPAAIRTNKYFKNLTTLSQVLPLGDIKKEWAKMGAVTKDERNTVLESLLRSRGYPVCGERGQAVTLPPAATLPAALPANESHGTQITTSAAAYVKMTAQERSDYGLRGGLLLASEFEKLSPAVRMSAMKSGVKTVDTFATPLPVKPAPAGVASMTRAQFEMLDAAASMAFIKSAGTVTEN